MFVSEDRDTLILRGDYTFKGKLCCLHLKMETERSFEKSRSTTTGQRKPQISHSVYNKTTNRLEVLREMVAIYCKNHTKHYLYKYGHIWAWICNGCFQDTCLETCDSALMTVSLVFIHFFSKILCLNYQAKVKN